MTLRNTRLRLVRCRRCEQPAQMADIVDGHQHAAGALHPDEIVAVGGVLAGGHVGDPVVMCEVRRNKKADPEAGFRELPLLDLN